MRRKVSRFFLMQVVLFYILISLKSFGERESSKEANGLPRGKEIYSVRVLGLFKPAKMRLVAHSSSGIWVVIDGEWKKRHRLTNVGKIEVLDGNLLSVKIGGKKVPASAVTISLLTADQKSFYGDVAIELPGKMHREYHGGLEVSAKNGELVILVRQRPEDLVRTVVSSESNAKDDIEYLKAQAIVTRTYIAANPDRHRKEGFDFCDNTHCQVFFGEDKKGEVFARAQRETLGKLLAWGDQIVDVYFTGVCGGKTAVPQMTWIGCPTVYPYEAVRCDYCADSKFFHWKVILKGQDIAKILLGDVHGTVSVKTDGDLDNSRPHSVRISSGNIERIVVSDQFRIEIGRRLGWNHVYSNWFSASPDADGRIVFEGRGFGHGVGFCQEGAKKMARIGADYRKVLSYYYPKARIAETDSH